jgi:hypothetical protein
MKQDDVSYIPADESEKNQAQIFIILELLKRQSQQTKKIYYYY